MKNPYLDCKQDLSDVLFQAKEREYQELLKARTTALQQGDRLLNQYRSNKNEVEQETTKLRALLREAESKYEQTVGQLVVMRTEHEKSAARVSQVERHLLEKMKELEACRELEADTNIR